MEIQYSKQAEKFLKKQDETTRNRIRKQFAPTWDEIEEEIPDETDLLMLKAIAEDPECHEFTKESEIDWND